jgi:large subunit ribosomal protein L4
MLSGHRAFAGETAADMFVQILEREPDWSLLPVDTPSAIVRLLERCLRKSSRKRLHDIADALLEIEDSVRDLQPDLSNVHGRVIAAHDNRQLATSVDIEPAFTRTAGTSTEAVPPGSGVWKRHGRVFAVTVGTLTVLGALAGIYRQRPGDDQEDDRRADGRRAQPAARQGRGARRPQRAGRGQEGRLMPSTTLYSKTGDDLGTVELPDSLFGAPVKPALLHQAVTAQLAARRIGTHDTKTRSEVRGGGRKPYRQKGTGRARQGSRRAPHYAGGGVVFGPHPRSYEQRMPKRMRRLALQGALTAKFSDGAVKVVDALTMDEIKTRELIGYLDALDATGRVLVVAGDGDARLMMSARNLSRVSIIRADSLNVVDVLNADTLLILQPSLEKMAEVYA